MNITWAGLACFKIEGENSTVVLDPYDASCGLKPPRLKAHLGLSTSQNSLHGNMGSISGIDGQIKIISRPGEYEVKEVLVYGMAAPQASDEALLYRVQIDGLTLVHLGSIGRHLDTAQLEYLDKVDILFIPVGGGKYLDAEQAVNLIQQIEPRIVVPMMYKTPGVKLPLDGLEKFIHELGVRPGDPVTKLKLAKKDLPSEEMKVVVFNPA